MKNILFILVAILLLFIGCHKENLNEDSEDTTEFINQEQDLRESNLAFINSEWNFDATGDSIKDKIVGLWLSNEVRYIDTICVDCDSLFTWVFESTGTMVRRNNDWGDHETMYGDWEIDKPNNLILFSYEFHNSKGDGNKSGNYQIMTDSIKIEDLSSSNLWVSQFIDYPPTTKIDIKFDRLK